MSEHANDDYHVHSHISSVKFYLGIFATLIACTVLTVALSYVHLGPLNLAVAVVIASLKATLVVMFFMHLKYDRTFNALIFVITLMFIGVFFAYTINDTGHRGQLDSAQGTMRDVATGKDAPGGFTPLTMPATHAAPGEATKKVEGAHH
ncbi:MAG: cytochrome C oxidase subunit IV family protein [Polyangiaceae bacterium]|nr:cytochrome C oxidase subunit IV family protein [Polyangiaceae bacterium]